MRRVAAHDPDQRCRSIAAKRWRMRFDPRRAFIIEVAGIATIVLSVAACSPSSCFPFGERAGEQVMRHILLALPAHRLARL